MVFYVACLFFLSVIETIHLRSSYFHASAHWNHVGLLSQMLVPKVGAMYFSPRPLASVDIVYITSFPWLFHVGDIAINQAIGISSTFHETTLGPLLG